MSAPQAGPSVPDHGVYVVLFSLAAPVELALGALGSHRLPAGWLLYVSRVGRGLGARLARHAAYDKKPRWHVDRLTLCDEASLAWSAVFPGLEDDAAASARLGAALRAAAPVEGFGASDGTPRLWWRPSAPGPAALGAALGAMPVVVRGITAG